MFDQCLHRSVTLPGAGALPLSFDREVSVNLSCCARSLLQSLSTAIHESRHYNTHTPLHHAPPSPASHSGAGDDKNFQWPSTEAGELGGGANPLSWPLHRPPSPLTAAACLLSSCTPRMFTVQDIIDLAPDAHTNLTSQGACPNAMLDTCTLEHLVWCDSLLQSNCACRQAAAIL